MERVEKMAGYSVTAKADMRCYPNYSLEIGDVDGDGRMEVATLSRSGNRLRVVNLDGEVLLERRLNNHGNWGTAPIAITDLDGDGREEIVVPDLGPRLEARIVAFNCDGQQVAEHGFGIHAIKDDYGMAVPLLAPMRLRPDGPRGLVAAAAGGVVIALDPELNELWRADGFRNDFGHEFCVNDVNADWLDEVAFCTCDHINAEPVPGWNTGEFVILDAAGRTMLRRRVEDYCLDTHFDDVAMGDFRGLGQAEIVLEKGFLIDLNGEVLWDVSDQFDHGQWIAHAPDPRGAGRLIFISELWGTEGKSALLDGRGETLAQLRDLPSTVLDASILPGWEVVPTRCHVVQWTPDSEPEIFVAEQVVCPAGHESSRTVSCQLKAFFLDLKGTLLGAVPFADAQTEGYFYNGEVHSRVADVDGDGRPEILFPRQDGKAMLIAKRM